VSHIPFRRRSSADPSFIVPLQAPTLPPFNTNFHLDISIFFISPLFQPTYHINPPATYSTDISALAFSLPTLLVPHDLFAFLFELLRTRPVNCVNINRACSSSPVHILSPSRFSFPAAGAHPVSIYLMTMLSLRSMPQGALK